MFKRFIKKPFNTRLIFYLAVSLTVIIVICMVMAILAKALLSYKIIENEFNKFTGLRIEFIKPKTTFDYKFNLNTKAEYINIYNDNKQTKYISIQNPDLSFKPFGILFKTINFKSLNAKNIVINIKRDEKGNIDLYDSLAKRDWSFLNEKKYNLSNINSKIEKIELNFDDKYQLKSHTQLILNDSDINISKKKKTLYISENGQINTNINSKNQKADISLKISSLYPLNNINSNHLSMDININNIDLYIFNDIAKKYISKDISMISGTSDLSVNTIHNEKAQQKLTFIIKNLKLKLKDNKTVIPYKENITAAALFKTDKNNIEIEDLTAKSNNLSISSKGNIIKPFSKKPDINLETKISNTQLNNFLYLLPDNLIFYRPKGIPALKKSNFHANLDGNINLNSLYPLNLTGTIKAGNVHIPSYPKPYRQNDVNAVFMKDKVRVYTRVYTPSDEYVTIDGISNLDDSLWGKYSVKSTDKIDLSYAQLYLVPIQQIIGFNIGPVPIMDISGYGNIDIKTQGTLKDAQIFGEFRAYQASAKIEGLDAKLTNGDCKLVFDNKNLIFKEIKGKMQEADFTLKGMGNTKGEVKLNASIKNARTHNVLKILNNSLISKKYTDFIKNITASSGKTEIDLNLEGTIKDYENPEFLADLKPSGSISLKNTKIILNNKLSLKNISGALNFGEVQSGLFEFFINNSKFNVNFSTKDSLEKIQSGELFEIKNELYSNKIAFQDIFNEYKNSKFNNLKFNENFNNFNFYTKLYVKSQGKISIKNIDLNNLKNSGYVVGLNNKESSVKFNSGLIKIQNNDLVFENFDSNISKGHAKIKGKVINFLSKKPQGDISIKLDNIDLKNISTLIPKLKLNQSILNNGQINFKNNDIFLNSISINYESMPLFLNAQIKDIYNLKNISANFSTILNEISTDSTINPYLKYPIKIKGEVPIKCEFKGGSDIYSINIDASVPKDSDIFFSGANLGDTNLKREIQGKIEVNDNIATIHNLKLIKFIQNQNNKINPITTLKANGKIVQKNDELFYENFKISTNTPINVRILNLIFKKSLLKKGNFECALNLNDSIKTPKINGQMLFEDLDIPLYNTQINNVSVNISDKFINGEILAKNKESDLKAVIKAQNKPNTPYIVEKIDISSNKLDIKNILNNITSPTQKNDIEKKNDFALNPNDLIIKNGSFDFKEIQWEKINAQNLKGNFNYDNSLFNLKNVIFDIAQGQINLNGNYSLKSTKLNLNAKMQDCDSNTLTKEFLNLENQIFGKLEGEMKLSAKGLNTPEGIKNIKSDVNFSVNNGKMPKLGSLEYLLRAGNLIKNGLLGLSLNNIIQVLTPYKTGDFEKISGSLSINNGNIENLEIFSKGKNLSLYLEGKYSILENFADIKIYGKLSQNISNALGAIGNASINQFINSISSKKDNSKKDEELLEKLSNIPEIEIENPTPRYFRAKVLGDINKDNYIKSFNWE